MAEDGVIAALSKGRRRRETVMFLYRDISSMHLSAQDTVVTFP
jgi:hypothetical protein